MPCPVLVSHVLYYIYILVTIIYLILQGNVRRVIMLAFQLFRQGDDICHTNTPKEMLPRIKIYLYMGQRPLERRLLDMEPLNCCLHLLIFFQNVYMYFKKTPWWTHVVMEWSHCYHRVFLYNTIEIGKHRPTNMAYRTGRNSRLFLYCLRRYAK